MEHSFCGNCIEISIQADEIHSVEVIAQLLEESETPEFEVGQTVSREKLNNKNQTLFVGQYVFSQGNDHKFVFHPKHKWSCKKMKKSFNCFVLVHLFSENKVIQTFKSKSFEVERQQRAKQEQRKDIFGNEISNEHRSFKLHCKTDLAIHIQHVELSNNMDLKKMRMTNEMFKPLSEAELFNAMVLFEIIKTIPSFNRDKYLIFKPLA